MFVLLIFILHGEYFFTKGFGKCMIHKALSQQVAEVALLSVLRPSGAGSQVIHTLWHSAPGPGAPGPHGRTHTLLLPSMGTWSCSSPAHCRLLLHGNISKP